MSRSIPGTIGRRSMSAVVLSMAFVLTACTAGSPSTAPASADSVASAPAASGVASPSAATAPVQISLGAFITPNLPQEFWNQLAADFEAANPGITVNVLFPPESESDISGYYKTLLASGKLPDVVTQILAPDFLKAGALYAYDINDPEIQKINNLDAVTVGGKLYSLATAIQPLSLIFYNKDLLAKAGITTPPTTIAELETAMAALKAAGITPMLTAGDQTGYIQWNAFTSADVFGTDPTWFTDRRDGKVHFAEGADLSWAKRISDWAKKGYFPDGASGLTYEQVTQDFLDGKGAMLANGIWMAASIAKATSPDKFGVFPAPTEDGQHRMATVQDGYCYTSASSPNVEAAAKLCEFISIDPKGHGQFLVRDGVLSGLKVPPAVPMAPLQQQVSDFVTGGYQYTSMTNGLGDQIPVSDMFGEITSSWQALLIGNDPTKVMTDLDGWWDEKQKAGG